MECSQPYVLVLPIICSVSHMTQHSKNMAFKLKIFSLPLNLPFFTDVMKVIKILTNNIVLFFKSFFFPKAKDPPYIISNNTLSLLKIFCMM